jgi:Phenylacetic acid degradation B
MAGGGLLTARLAACRGGRGDARRVSAEGGPGVVPTAGVPLEPDGPPPRSSWPLFEVFVRGKRWLNHVHVGSLRAGDDHRAGKGLDLR